MTSRARKLQVVGAGFPRTGTTSLRFALRRLLGADCYHMREVAEHPEHAVVWRDALTGDLPDWKSFLEGYAAAVDWPAARFWRELSAVYPDAIVLLSRRDTPQRWYTSMDRTILPRARAFKDGAPGHASRVEGDLPAWLAGATVEQRRAMDDMFWRMGGTTFAHADDPAAVVATYQRHLEQVRAEVPASRLVEWQPGDGWQPLCTALGLSVPDEPFPHENTAEEMAAKTQGQSSREDGT